MKGSTIIEQTTVLEGRYRLTEHIGTGGSADVWRATDELLNRQVAVKVLREMADTIQRDRFVEEAQTLASFNHPGLVVLLDAGISGERPFLVMTLADDATLASRIQRGPVESAVVKSIGSQVALALAYVHDRGVVHRDVKPSNVLLCADGRAVLSDFGIARLIDSAMHHTRTGEAIGSPAYLAPEQVAGEPLTPALDIYSLGLVLLEALTATRAFPGPPVEAAIARLSSAPPMPISVGREWASLITRMTHRNPDQRPTAHEVAEELGGTALAVPSTTRTDGGREVEPEATGEIPILASDAASTMTLAPVLAAAAVADRREPAISRIRRHWPSVAAVVIAALALSAFTLLHHSAGGVSKTDATSGPGKVPAKHQPAAPRLRQVATEPTRAPAAPKRTAKPAAKPTKAASARPNTPSQAPTPTPTPAPAASTPAPPPPAATPTDQTTPQAVTSPTP